MYDRISAGALDYAPYRLEGSRLLLRGPRPQTGGTWCAFLGGSETYGRFVPAPYPALVERSLGLPCANFGCHGGGIEVYLKDEALLEACRGASVTVIAATGAHALSNRYFKVHPRRNDRFIRASAALKDLYRDVDFSEFHFTRHMLTGLHARSAERFARVVAEMQAAWMARMRTLIGLVGGRVILLWLGEDDAAGDPDMSPPFGPEPLFVTARMIDELRLVVHEVVICRSPPLLGVERSQGMVMSEIEAPLARAGLPVALHRRAAEALVGPLRRLFMASGRDSLAGSRPSARSAPSPEGEVSTHAPACRGKASLVLPHDNLSLRRDNII